MIIYDKLQALRAVCDTNYWAKRIYSELAYLSALSSVNDGKFDDAINGALDMLTARLAENHAIVKCDALDAEEMLSELSSAAKSLKVMCISHAHIDMNWMWGYNETVAVTVDTFRTILNLMKEYPDFTYAQSQASTYKIIEENAPEMIDEIKKYVHEGRWEITASTWVETDKNMPNGESLSRHILYTKRYLAGLFDIDPDSLNIDFEPDTFGHNASVPEICNNGGIKYYYHCRGYDGKNDIYRWRSPSGKELLVYRDPHWYNGNIDIASFVDIPLICAKNGTDTFLHVYGVGDHGGGPSRSDIERLIDDAKFPLYPTIEFGTFGRYFAAIDKDREKYPIVEGELNFIFTGCYTSQSRIKMANRIGEDRAYEAEVLSGLAQAAVGASSKTRIFEGAWQKILFNHFHDIIPGSGVVETREYAMGIFQNALGAINTNANTAMRDIADSINTDAVPFEDAQYTTSEGSGVGFAVSHISGHKFPQTERGRGKVRAIHLYNTTMYDRAEPVEVTVWDYNYDLGLLKVTDSDGNTVAHEIINNGSGYWGHHYVTLLIDAKIPAFGYSTYILSLNSYGSIGQFIPTDRNPRRDTMADTDFVLENSKLRAVFDRYTFAITELCDKTTGEMIVKPDRPSAIFRYITEDARYGMTSWRVGPYKNIEILNTADHNIKLKDYGVRGLRSYLVYEVGFASSTLKVTAELRKDQSVISFRADVDWHEVGNAQKGIPQLNFVMPVAYAAENYSYDIPLSKIDRPALAHDVPGRSYIRIAKKNGSSAFVVTDSKYGFRGTDNSGAVTLIRGSYDPDPYPERGIHHIGIGVGLCKSADQQCLADKYAHPISFNAGYKHDGGRLPMNGSFLKLDGLDTLTVSAIKSGEDGGTIIRIAEYAGKSGRVKVSFSDIVGAPKSASLVDITERHEIGECVVDGNTVEFDIAANSMATLRVKW